MCAQSVISSGSNTDTRVDTCAVEWPSISSSMTFLRHVDPHVNQTTPQVVHVLHFSLVDALLHCDPRFCRIHIRAVWWLQIWRDKRRCLIFQKVDCFAWPVCWSTVLLNDKKLARHLTYMHVWRPLATVVQAARYDRHTDPDTRVDKHQTALVQCWHADWYQQWVTGWRAKQAFWRHDLQQQQQQQHRTLTHSLGQYCWSVVWRRYCQHILISEPTETDINLRVVFSQQFWPMYKSCKTVSFGMHVDVSYDI